MAHFALVDDGGIVREVIVISNVDCGGGDFPDSEPIGQAFITGAHPDGLAIQGDWRQTSYSGSFRGCFAGIGYSFDTALNVFVPPAALEVTP